MQDEETRPHHSLPGGALRHERRRPGRVEIENQHLIRMLRAPHAPVPESEDAAPQNSPAQVGQSPPPASMPPARGMLPMTIVAVLFWGILLAGIWLR